MPRSISSRSLPLLAQPRCRGHQPRRQRLAPLHPVPPLPRRRLVARRRALPLRPLRHLERLCQHRMEVAVGACSALASLASSAANGSRSDALTPRRSCGTRVSRVAALPALVYVLCSAHSGGCCDGKQSVVATWLCNILEMGMRSNVHGNRSQLRHALHHIGRHTQTAGVLTGLVTGRAQAIELHT